ncbi:hypothetical protein HYT25_00195 [Candidatus Pacearchaeota archaeon]|nr:hypothetical protein [Candidatus Pacearchaeota archaeon]
MSRTLDGLPVVTEQTLIDFSRVYAIASPNNDPLITAKIRDENPQIYRILKIGMEQAPNKEARAYYEMGMQIIYELFRGQVIKDSK